MSGSGSGSGIVHNPPTEEPPETDLDSIGHHCDLEYCHQLDFLPFRCASCRGVFCLDHRTESAHQCPRAGEWVRSSAATTTTTTNPSSGSTSISASSTPPTKPTIHNTAQCSHLACKTLIHTLSEPGVRCPECRREYCLKHRLREGHACQPFVPGGKGGGGGGAGQGQDTLKSMFARVRGSFASLGGGGGNAGKSRTATAPGKTMDTKQNKAGATATATTTTTKKSKPVNRAMAVNALKRTAKGDAAVPAERRVYLSVEAAAAPTRGSAAAGAGAAGAAGASGAFWFDGKWKVGRVLDDAARRLGVENVNNRVAGEEERLRVFHVDGGVFLEFGDTLGEKVVAGDTLVLLRGAGVIL
ncbi:AN1-type zinc finger protein [Aspergillus aculeatinus CBS 121060]|uniref:Uncharacterized protein n=1 Tax=Aspergillus aculeatinus CBS 121060 TaxID=1448322 RepID=A0ACD1HEQ9_9EURO|nr:hypothetical protein BO66DRAFT_44221 [Aspergillus aculeatinus CBS 121060]RAH71970.1 hypothetical protein BO66DRAFT_44221 [Aspergillus aculeatinus CBS 121060]